MPEQWDLYRSPNASKKFLVISPEGHRVLFGAAGYSDYTLHHDKERRARYAQRHARSENWKKSGINTAGFWSYWLLWNKPSLRASIADIERRFNIRIVFHRSARK